MGPPSPAPPIEKKSNQIKCVTLFALPISTPITVFHLKVHPIFLFPSFIVNTKKSTHNTFFAQTCKPLRVKKYVVLGLPRRLSSILWSRSVLVCPPEPTHTVLEVLLRLVGARRPVGQVKTSFDFGRSKSRDSVCQDAWCSFRLGNDSSSFESTVHTRGRCPPCPSHKKNRGSYASNACWRPFSRAQKGRV